jgi:hypothetical protein
VETVMQTPLISLAYQGEAACEAQKADIAELRKDLQTMQALLTAQRERRPWWRRLFAAGTVMGVAMIVGTVGAKADDGMREKALYDFCSKPERSAFTAHCFAYVMAISDVMRADGPGVYGLKSRSGKFSLILNSMTGSGVGA